MILIISTGEDDHAAAVVTCLAAMGRDAHLLDLSRFPIDYHVSIDYSRDAPHARFVGPEEVPASECSVVWWRRPQPLRLHDDLATSTNRTFAHGECHEAIAGLWLLLPATWINHPTRDEEASHKALQIQVAREVGLAVPRTRITSDPAAAREFVREVGVSRTVYKAFTGTEHAWRETRILREEEVELLDDVRFAPVIFQEFVPAELDLRVTVMDRYVFASAVHTSADSYEADYRIDLNRARVEPCELPREVVRRIHALMDRLGLVYGAIDLRKTPQGDFVFLEINPSGQWLFMEERTGQQMTATFAKLLASRAAAPVGSEERIGRRF